MTEFPNNGLDVIYLAHTSASRRSSAERIAERRIMFNAFSYIIRIRFFFLLPTLTQQFVWA